ncbi:hypothetical protein GH714_013900 [Hevea brasiliensis]|uniref:Alpha/beta hydrolase fold-3 domain-containing protein n=1 Tax=Hevea brasiliensis TaxID=3981 RepID=A0A6A6NBY1_HEVBR|nr:hypothetical protein GH714_013900 [Hevea brasiliensis]
MSHSATPYEVDECRGVLRVYSDGSIWRSTEPSFKVPVHDDGSVLWKDIIFDPVNNLHLRLYKPAFSSSSTKLPIFYYIHGGGFCIGSRTWPNCQNYCFKLCLDLQAVIVSPDYRLAPENRLPAAIEDGFLAVKWLQGNILQESVEIPADGAIVDTEEYSESCLPPNYMKEIYCRKVLRCLLMKQAKCGGSDDVPNRKWPL